uniref:Protein kinase domain-containing protein n=2 Tax=Ascaris TaxID=6251 RepID=A0A0M3I5R4_ASCLU
MVAYHLERYIGRGGYGEVYECRTEDNNKKYALKRENIRRTHIPTEVEVLKSANRNGCKQLCKFIDDGIYENYVFVVMSLLGKDLSKLRKQCPSKTFSLGTSLRLGLMTLSAIKELHQLSVVSRDIKPSNFAIGRGDDSRNVFLFDFGLSRVYRSEDGTIIPPSVNAGFKGTTRYASIRAHQKKELGRSDDLESWLYVNVEFSTGRLPWKSSRGGKGETKGHCKERILQLKKMVRIGTKRTRFFEGCPPVLDPIFAMVDALDYESDPPYDQIKFMFEKSMLEADVRWNDAFDWETETGTLPPARRSPLGATLSTSAISTYGKSVALTYAKTSLTASTQSSSVEVERPLIFNT